MCHIRFQHAVPGPLDYEAIPGKTYGFSCTGEKCPLAQEFHYFVSHNRRFLDAVPMTNTTQNLEMLV